MPRSPRLSYSSRCSGRSRHRGDQSRARQRLGANDLWRAAGATLTIVYMRTVPNSSTAFRALDQAQCTALLKAHKVGRIAAGLEGWPAILPVNYVYDDGNVAIRTGFGAVIEEIPMTAVAFEIDDWDPDGAWGWSVMVQGPAFDITHTRDERSVRLRATKVKPFAPGRKENWIRVAVVRMTGRAFGPLKVDS